MDVGTAAALATVVRSPRCFVLSTILSLITVAACTAGDAGPADDTGDDGGGDDTLPSDPVLISIQSGAFAPLAPYTGIAGQAIVVRGLDGRTDVSLALSGLPPSAGLVGHVHAQPCAYQGGGHYKIDPLVVDTVEANELWFLLETSPTGVAVTASSFEHAARGDALSIVVHDASNGNAKMTCADLVTGHDAAVVDLGGTLEAFAPAADPIDATVAGSAHLARSAAGTDVTLEVTGLDNTRVYGAHVHAEPCEIDKGSGHYKIDPTVATTESLNEIWLAITDFADGSTTSIASTAHAARTDAQSVVVHRLDGALNPKIACAALVRETPFPPMVTAGPATVLPGGAGLDLVGTATMTRTLAGVTEVSVEASGLTAGETYSVHVHDQPCSIEAGGGHYVRDRAAATGEANEIWLALEADSSGAALDTIRVAHLARAEARSVVLHGAEGARLACFDLR